MKYCTPCMVNFTLIEACYVYILKIILENFINPLIFIMESSFGEVLKLGYNIYKRIGAIS